MTFPLELHSCYSMMAGTAWPRQLVARAVEYGLESLALTDTNGLYGAIAFYTAARTAGIKPILGARLGPCLVLARDREGYAQLCEIITRIRLGETDAHRLDVWPFAFDASRLFLISDDRALLRRLHAKGLSPLAGIGHCGGGAARRRVEALIGTAKRLGVRITATAPTYFLNREDHRRHCILTAIRLNTTATALSAEATAPAEAWFRSPDRIERLYGPWPEALDTAAWVAEECNLELPLGAPLFPEFPLPENETAASWLWKETFAGLRRRYPSITPRIRERACHELGIINDLGFAPYFLIVMDIVRFAQSRDIPVVGRGSAANSLVAYALGITRADPFRHNLYFERFLNRSRGDCPDIDLDLCWRGRDQVLAYVYERFGGERVAMISTVNTLQARSAVRETAKALGFTEREVGPITRVIPHYGAEDLRLLLETMPECAGLRLDAEPLKSVIDLAQSIAGLPRHLSIHAGGMVIAPDAITRYTPLERAPKGMVITQYDKDPIEQLGLVKMDLLGHRALSAIHDTVAAIRRRDPDFAIEAIPDPDPAAAALLRVGDTVGCFQIESPAMRGLLRRLAAEDCNSVIQAIALVRPGASGSGMKQHFIDRRHGREPVEYAHPAMKQALGDTYGVMIYQEDVLKVAHAVAGMDLAEADALRRAMTKKRSPRAMARLMRRFIEGAAGNGVSGEAAKTIWELVANFAAYAYCKAHAATYGELACQCVWLKAHYPVEYFAAILANGGGFYSAPVYISEARRCGVPVLPPDVNHSIWTYAQQGAAVRLGFAQVAELTKKTVHALLDARAAGPFRDMDDLLGRIHIPAADALALCQSGALDNLPGTPDGAPLTRAMQLWRIKTQRREDGQRLFAVDVRIMPVMPDYSMRRRCDLEWRRLGALLSTHPLRYVAPICWERPCVASNHLPLYDGRRVSLIGVIIAARRLSLRDGRGCMKFITIEDAWGVCEAVLFPEAYRRYGALTQPGRLYVYTGVVRGAQDDAVVNIEHIMRPEHPHMPWTGHGG